MPDSLTNCSGRIDRPQHASMIDAVTESWPHPAHTVDMLPSYWRRVMPRLLVGSEGWATLGLLMYDLVNSLGLARHRRQARHLGELGPNFIDDGVGRHGKTAVAQDGEQLRFFHRGLERQQRFELRVAILFDDENGGMRFQEGFDVVVEREGLDAQIVHLDLLPSQH